MGDVPINPTGFAHGFHPLDGDHPPATPTQQGAAPAAFPNASFFTPSQPAASQSASHSQGGSGMGGMGGARKRRRLPGPLAFLQQGGSGAAGDFGQDGGESDEDNHQRSNDRGQSKVEGGGGHFGKGAWLSLCSAIDAPIPDKGSSDARAAQTFMKGALSPMSEVLAGDFDLRVPVVTAVIDSYHKLSHSDVVVELVDPSGRMKGHLHPGCVEEHGPTLGPGAAVLLKEVSIFVSGPGTTRLLNVHPACVLAVFPADSPLPTPTRLDWLKTCDPPFTPRPVPDCGGNARQPEEHRTSSRTTSTSNPPPERGSGRRRARPLSRQEQNRSHQLAPSRPPPPRPQQQSQPAELRESQGRSGTLAQSGSTRGAIDITVLGDSQASRRGGYDDDDGDEKEEEEDEGGRGGAGKEEEGEEEREEKEEGEKEGAGRLPQSAIAATDSATPSFRTEDADGVLSSPPYFSCPGRASPDAQPPLSLSPNGLLTPNLSGSTPIGSSQFPLAQMPVDKREGFQGVGGTLPLPEASCKIIPGDARVHKACDSTVKGGEKRNPTTPGATGREKARRTVYLDSPGCGVLGGSAVLGKPAYRNEARGILLEAPPPVSTAHGSGPDSRIRDKKQQREGNAVESATFRDSAPETHLSRTADIAESIAEMDSARAAATSTIPSEGGCSKGEAAGVGVEPAVSVDEGRGVAGQTRVSSSMWSDLDGLDSDYSDETTNALLPGRGSSVIDCRQAGDQLQSGNEQEAGGSRETVPAKHSGRPRDSSNLRETAVDGRDATTPLGERRTLVGDASLSDKAIPTGGNRETFTPSNAEPDQPMTLSPGDLELSAREDTLSPNLGGTPVAASPSGASHAPERGGIFSMLGSEGGFENDDMLDAALDDSDQE